MDALESLIARARRVGGSTAAESTANRSGESKTEDNDEVSQAYRLLRLVMLVLIIILIALTIARMLGWL